MKPTLAINKNSLRNPTRTLGMTELLQYLIDSDLFEIIWHEENVPLVNRHDRATILFYNDKKILLDLWEYSSPTYCEPICKGNYDLFIKLQHNNMDHEVFEKKCQRKKVLLKVSYEERHAMLDKVVPWTFFSSTMMQKFVNHEDEVPKVPIEQLGFFCGKHWKARKSMVKRLQELNIEFIASDIALRTGRPITDDEYMHKMLSSKYGIVLHGRQSHFTEGKNRREIDYMILRKPLLLNYRPFYYEPLIEGTHYIYIDQKIDFDEIESMYNVDEMVEAAFQWYKRNVTPMGAAQTFLRIMKDRFGE